MVFYLNKNVFSRNLPIDFQEINTNKFNAITYFNFYNKITFYFFFCLKRYLKKK